MMEFIMWFFLCGIMFISLIYLVFWLVVEMPVLVKIKHEELYKRWKKS